jgi:hypothetical protein
VRFLVGFGRFWYDFIIGDDWKIAAAVTSVLLLGAVVVYTGWYSSGLLTVLLALGIAAAFTTALLVDVGLKRK